MDANEMSNCEVACLQYIVKVWLHILILNSNFLIW